MGQERRERNRYNVWFMMKVEGAATRTAPLQPAPDDRRAGTRHSVWFPLKVDTPEQSDGVAVSRNISETGVLMLSATKLDPGSTVTVTFRVDRQGPERTVDA